jgi:hypothetical protein
VVLLSSAILIWVFNGPTVVATAKF